MYIISGNESVFHYSPKVWLHNSVLPAADKGCMQRGGGEQDLNSLHLDSLADLFTRWGSPAGGMMTGF